MKANWKKILMGGILLSASAVLLTACGGAEKTKAENESGSANKAAGDVKLWVDTEYMGVFKKVVADFEKENPDIKVNLTAGNLRNITFGYEFDRQMLKKTLQKILKLPQMFS